MDEMFCFQCQETAQNSGCTVRGVCGKTAATAGLMDELIRQLKIIAMTRKADRETGRFAAKSLFMTLTNTNFDDSRLQQQLREAGALVGNRIANVAGAVCETEDEDIRSLRELLTYGTKGVAAYAHHAAVLGHEDDGVYEFIFRALAGAAVENSAEKLTALIMECGSAAVNAMALLDRANTASFGNPRRTVVRTGVGSRPGILVSGHDLLDLAQLLEQSKGCGIDIYTHGEMLPAHYYPELSKYSHLYGNYGGSWHRQESEFASFWGPVLVTSNCLIPVREGYRSRIFTTGVAGYPGIPHIPDGVDGAPKDFSQLIAAAQDSPLPEVLEKGSITGGFAHGQLFAMLDEVVAAVKAGQIRRFIVMAGCDGRHRSREYYTAVAAQLPADTVILTAGCAKYRYLKSVSGEISGIPRVLDAGQCNDCYSLAVLALKLKELFKVDDVNKLPISFDIAWYEQKAVAVLLALLSLGFRNIRLGPTLPAFISPAVAGLLGEAFGLRGITSPEEDVAAMMKGE